MKKTKLIYLSFSIFFFLIFLCACFSPFKGDQGAITINFGSSGMAGYVTLPAGETARAGAWPPESYGILEQIEHRVRLTGNGSPISHTARGETTITIFARPGNYDISIEAYYGGLLYATGISSVNVKANQDNPVPIKMEQSDNTFFMVANATDWDLACGIIAGNGNNKSYLINIIDDVPGIVGLVPTGYSFGFAEDISVAIRGDYTLSLSSTGTGSLLKIRNGQSVSIHNTKLQGRGSGIINNVPLVSVENGSLSMSGTASVSGNYSNSTINLGGGVYVVNSSFSMSGNASVHDNEADSGGGGVHVDNGSFNMSDNASVHDNEANLGGGVHVLDSNFSMSGNTSIHDN